MIGGAHEQEFAIPNAVSGLPWQLFINTAAKPPGDIYPSLDGPEPPLRNRFLLQSHSMVCYVAPDEQ